MTSELFNTLTFDIGDPSGGVKQY